jgi:hypothetical protein
MSASGMGRSFSVMKRRLLFILLVTGLIVLALGGWTLQGARRLAGGGRSTALPQTA